MGGGGITQRIHCRIIRACAGSRCRPLMDFAGIIHVFHHIAEHIIDAESVGSLCAAGMQQRLRILRAYCDFTDVGIRLRLTGEKHTVIAAAAGVLPFGAGRQMKLISGLFP